MNGDEKVMRMRRMKRARVMMKIIWVAGAGV
jgi:hypothetical protein